MSTAKVLTVGSAVGSIKELFAKVKSIDEKHGKFDCVLCLGDFFGPPKAAEEEYDEDHEIMQLLDGRLEAPLECYIMQGEHPLPAPVIEKFAKTGGALSKNVFLLHKSGVLTTPHGIRIACLAGIFDSNIYTTADSAHGFTSPYFTTHTVEKLLANTMSSSKPAEQNYTSLASIKSSSTPSQLIDILITNAWPAGITEFSSAPLPAPELSAIGVEPVSEVVRRTKPRYHFAAGGGHPPRFWEREPYTWDDAEDKGRIGRFVSLGAFGGEQPSGKKPRVRPRPDRLSHLTSGADCVRDAYLTGSKLMDPFYQWFYAFSIAALSATSEPQPKPANATQNPFLHRAPKRRLESGVQQPGKRSRTDGPQGKPPAGYKCKVCESEEHFIMDCPEREKPKEGYICKICNEPGHFVRDCPVKHAVGDTGGRKPREGYVCRACGSELHYIQDCPVANQTGKGQGRRGPPKEIAPDECWFCLSNPNLAKHLIVSIGSECYVTLPKGQLIPTHQGANHPNVPRVPGGGHVLIVPITHYPTYLSIPPDLAEPIVNETEKYKSALRSMYAKHGAAAVCFEVGRMSAKGGHAHVQVVPVPNKLKNAVEDTFREEGRASNITFEEDPDEALRAAAGGRGGYFRADLPDGRKLVHLMREHGPFSIQFGRQVMASILGMGDRFDWKACTQSEQEDREDVQAFKGAFAPFDPSLEL